MLNVPLQVPVDRFPEIASPSSLYDLHTTLARSDRYAFLQEHMLQDGALLIVVVRDQVDGEVYRLAYLPGGDYSWRLMHASPWMAEW